MRDYSMYTREQFLERIEALENLLAVMREERMRDDQLNFPWAGNLGQWYWHVPSNEVVCNPQKILALGYEMADIPDSLGFEYFTDKLHPEDYERVMSNMREHLTGQSPAYEVSYRIRTVDGDWKWFYDRGKIIKHDQTGRPMVVGGIVFDITEQKKMEQTLREQNEVLHEMATTDALTRIYNRQTIHERLQEEIDKMQGRDRLSILIIDIDHFKEVNDQYGHLVGDQILTQVAQTIRNELRASDQVGRYGGEEFLVVLPHTDMSRARKIAERIRLAVQATETVNGVKVTISGGLAEYKAQSLDEFIDKADQRLYSAKHNGRNQIAH